MTSWMNDAAAVQNHNGAAFNSPLNDPNAGVNMLDPSVFMSASASFDPSQFQNQQLQQRMPNGGLRNTSPAFNNPIYQTNPVVPSKRARPREDSLGTSPRQAPGMLPNSRSQTPQQVSYPGFQPNSQPQQPTPYSHLQHNGSTNASPSPIMANQLRPGTVPQRVSTASPHPFSPAAQQFGAQASPSQSEHGNRVDTPQNQYMQNPAFQQGFTQSFTPPTGRTSAPPQGGMLTPQMPPGSMHPQAMYQQQQPQQPQQHPRPQPQSLEHQKMMYQMQMQQQLAQRSSLMQAQRMQNMPQNPNQIKQPMQPANGQYPQGMRPQQPASRSNNPEQFMKHLTTFMQTRGQTLDPNPIVGDRSINVVMLYMAVAKFGGYRAVNIQNMWPQVAQTLQINPMQNQSAPQQIRGHYERNLMMFEEAYNQQQMRQKQAMIQRNAGMAPGQPQMSPTKPMHPQVQQQQPQQFMQQQSQNLVMQHPQSTPVKQTAIAQPTVNGFSTPQAPPQPNQHQANAQANARNSMSRSIDATPPQNGSSFTMPSPASGGKSGSISMQSPHPDATVQASTVQTSKQYETEIPAVYDPSTRELDTWGGIACDSLPDLVHEYIVRKPNVPSVMELGVIDIHALTMSLKCGIHAEVRLALDTLATISVEGRLNMELRSCEDLVETIIDCAEAQVDLLAENAAEVSDVMLISSYEDVVRGCRLEREGLQDIPEFGTLEYDLDRSVERLVCITTILRNWSFYEPNHPLLADDLVIKFLCIVIRYLGTRNMLLRTNANTLDFMKDAIIFLSNLAQAIEIPGREQALCLLHFLLAFAPCPPPSIAGTEKVTFSPYEPAIHRYLPPAVDSLAKLLARDEPNRTFYKTLFGSESSSSPPFDLLTKAFALAISPIPGHRRDEQRQGLMKIVEARKPHLMQGLLAAEILSSLAPGHEMNLAKAWLTSEDGFAQCLLRLITVLSSEPSPPPPRGAPQHRGGEDDSLLHITLNGITILRRLTEKTRNPDDPNSVIPLEGMIKQENLLGALLLKQGAQPKPEVIRQLCMYAALDR